MQKTDAVYEKIREGILSGELRPNQVLIETEIAEKMGVSRTPVRVAMGILEARGYITDKGGITIVREHSQDDVINSLEIREALETKGISLACVRASEADIKLAEVRLKEDALAIANQDVVRFLHTNAALHRAFLGGCGNEMLVSQVFDWWHYGPQIIRMYTRADWRRIAREHEAIFESLRNRDQAAASKAMRQHITHFITLMQRLMGVPGKPLAALPIKR